jgi:hypothetical protein
MVFTQKFLLIPLAFMIVLGIIIASGYNADNDASNGTVTGLGVTGRLIEKTFIPSSHIQDMAYSNLAKFISENKTAIIFFYDNSCDVCIAQISEIDALLENLNSTNPEIFSSFKYFEYDFNTGLRDKFNVTHHHTLILIKNGEEVLRTREAMTKEELLEKIIS